MAEEEVTEDRLLGGAVRLLQPRRGHRAGTDAVLLAQLAPVRPGDRVVDLGAASGAVGLMIAQRVPDAEVTLVEREPDLAALATRNIALNGFAGRVAAIGADIFGELAGLEPGAADLVVTNPPFFEDGKRSSPDLRRRAAHVMEGGGLAGWLAAAARLAKPRGRLCMIHRADALPLCLEAIPGRFGSLEVRPVHPRAEEPASRILVFGVKGGRAPFRLAPPLVLHDADGAFTPEAACLHAGQNEKGA